MRSYCRAQGTLLMLCSDLKGKETQRRVDTWKHITDAAIQQNLSQQCKATICQ